MEEKIVLGFMSVFEGMTGAHGTYEITTTKTSGKRVGDDKTIKTLKKPVTFELWRDHLTGAHPYGIGIIPIKEDSTCYFGAIDIDVYDGFDHSKMVQRLKSEDIPIVVCRTKSGGAHLYLFCKNPTPARTLIAKLREIAAFIGFGKSEIFPKQEEILVDRGDIGQWINMPYYRGMQGMRYGVKIDGDAMTPEEFLAIAEKSRVEEDFFERTFDIVSDFQDGPPCLTTLVQLGFPDGTRNNGLYNLGVYFKKAFPDTWENLLDQANVLYMKPPLLSQEVQGTIRTLRKKDYRYKCSDQPICNHCNKPLCKTRKHGVSDAASSLPTFGTLTKLDVSPVIWFWDIEGHRVELTTEQLQSPQLFQRACMEGLNIVVPAIPRPAWQEVLQQGFANLVVIEGTADGTPEGLFMELLEKFCTSRAVGKSLEEILLGKAVVFEGKAHFRISDLMAFLERAKFREFKQNKICAILRSMKAQHGFKVLKGKPVNYWVVPEFAQQTSTLDLPDDMPEEQF